MLNLECPAKVNLALAVGAPSAAHGGLHPIASWMAVVHLADQLTLARADDQVSRFDIGFAPDVAGAVDWPADADLARRAHALLQQRLKRPLPVRLTLRKRIPPGAGLGGGSSNAAATLVGLRRLFALEYSDAQLVDLGLQLGSDVGFLVGAVLGVPTALVGGCGERIEPLPLAAPLQLVLIFPGFGSPTGQVYAAFDRLTSASRGGADEARVRALAQRAPLCPDELFNDLTDAAIAVNPALGEIKARVEKLLPLSVHVTGSGSTLFAGAPEEAVARNWARLVTARTGLTAIATRTVGPDRH